MNVAGCFVAEERKVTPFNSYLKEIDANQNLYADKGERLKVLFDQMSQVEGNNQYKENIIQARQENFRNILGILENANQEKDDNKKKDMLARAQSNLQILCKKIELKNPNIEDLIKDVITLEQNIRRPKQQAQAGPEKNGEPAPAPPPPPQPPKVEPNEMEVDVPKKADTPPSNPKRLNLKLPEGCNAVSKGNGLFEIQKSGNSKIIHFKVQQSKDNTKYIAGNNGEEGIKKMAEAMMKNHQKGHTINIRNGKPEEQQLLAKYLSEMAQQKGVTLNLQIEGKPHGLVNPRPVPAPTTPPPAAQPKAPSSNKESTVPATSTSGSGSKESEKKGPDADAKNPDEPVPIEQQIPDFPAPEVPKSKIPSPSQGEVHAAPKGQTYSPPKRTAPAAPKGQTYSPPKRSAPAAPRGQTPSPPKNKAPSRPEKKPNNEGQDPDQESNNQLNM